MGGGSLPAVRVRAQSAARSTQLRHRPRGRARGARRSANANRPKGAARRTASRRWQIRANDQLCDAAEYRPLIVAYRNGAPVRLGDVAEVRDSVRGPAHRRPRQRQARRCCSSSSASPAPTSSRRSTASARCCPQLHALDPADDRPRRWCSTAPRPSAPRCATSSTRWSSPWPWWCWWCSLFLRNGAPPLIPERRGAGLADRHLRRHVPARLQPRQPLADGAHHRHRLRGGRRHRGAGEHHAPPRGGHAARSRRRSRARARSASPCSR